MSQQPSSKWVRPDSVPYPTIWSKFEGRKEIGGAIPKFWIQDIPENQFETVISVMENGYLKDEPLNMYSNVLSDEQSVIDIREIWTGILQDKMGLICYMENPDPNGQPIIAAINCTHVVLEADNDPILKKVNGVKSIKIVSCVDILARKRNAYKELKVDKYLNGMGMYVLPQFRGQGLGLELLKAREPLCKAMGIQATLTIFTATASQIVAARAGFKVFSAIPYADFEKNNPTLRFPGIEKHTKEMKSMYMVYS